MLTLYDREECPQCRKVRQLLALQDITYTLNSVPRLHSARTEVLALDGIDVPEVPVLTDGDTVIQGADAILAHLKGKYTASSFGDPHYGITRKLDGVSYADALPAVIAALKTQGFGVLTEIDVSATLKKKIGVEMRPYIILGACNPKLAHHALTAELPIGLLLPCNVVVAEDQDGSAVVSAIDPKAMFKVVDRDDVAPLADEVRTLLRNALAAITL